MRAYTHTRMHACIHACTNAPNRMHAHCAHSRMHACMVVGGVNIIIMFLDFLGNNKKNTAILDALTVADSESDFEYMIRQRLRVSEKVFGQSMIAMVVNR